MKYMKNNFLLSLGISSLLFSGMTISLEAWTTPETISSTASSVNPSATNLTIDQNSNAVVGWLEGTLGVDNNLLSAFLSAGAPNWSTPNSLYSGTSPEFACFPLIYTDNNGTAYAFWANFHQGDTSFDQTTIATSSEGFLDTSWGTAVLGTIMNGFPNGGGASVDELGNRVAVLALTTDSSTNPPPYAINFSALAFDAGSWTTPILLDTDESTLSGPVVFNVSSHGESIIGWRINPELTFKTARYSFATDTITALNNIPLPTSAVDVGFVKSAIGANGDVTVVFSARIGTPANYILYSTFLPAGSDTWTYPAIISNTDNNTNNNYLSIDMDRNNNTTIVWGEVTPSNDGYLRAATLPFGGSLSSITDIASVVEIDDMNQNSGAMVDVDAFGNAVATWNQVVEGNSIIQVASRPEGGSWTAADTLSGTGNIPRVALSEQGTAVVVWLDTVTSYLYGTSSNLFPVNAPQSFGGFITADETTCYLNMHWSPSLAPNISNYQIFRGSTLIATIAGSGPFTSVYPIDCGFIEGDYTIIAEASNGNQSAPVTLVLAH